MERHKIFPARLVIDSMRDSGYRDAAHAIAELIDNSIQAGKNLNKCINVKLICIEEAVFINDRRNNQIKKIAIYDDAGGMSPETLSLCLAFGQGTRRGAKEGMGKFGMGLPSASISQCKRVDIWSWQNGKIFHTYLDIEEITQDHDMVPELQHCESLPKEWSSKIGDEIGKSGTLVVWTDIDRLRWRRHKAFFSNTAFIVGRMYRYFLQSSKAKITMVAYEGNDFLSEQKVLPNDPLYLMENTQAPEPYSKEPGFDVFCDEVVSFKLDGEEHEIKLKFSIVKQSFRRKLEKEGGLAGSTPFGKQCAKNQGISIVRAGREIDMNHTFETDYNPVERWWGVEVAFEPGADKIFGVTNNKQFATSFKRLIASELAEQENMLEGEMRTFLEEQEDIRLPILSLSDKIISVLKEIRTRLKAQTHGVKKQTKAGDGTDLASNAANEVTKNDGEKGISDKKNSELTEEQKQKEIKGAFEEDYNNLGKEESDQIMNRWLCELKFIFSSKEMRGSQIIFDVSQPAGKIKVTFNTKHPVYEKFIRAIEEEDGLAFASLKLLFAAWARMEDIEAQSEERRELLLDIRMRWGQIAKNMLDEYFK